MQNYLKNETVVYPVILWGIQFVLAISVVFISTRYFQHGPHIAGSLHGNWVAGFGNWDGTWYLSIVQNGYGNLESTAFFPFYPIAIRLVHQVTSLSFLASAFWLSNLSLLLGMIFLYKVTVKLYGGDIAKMTCWLLITFPASMFFHVTYTESLTLLSTVLFFYFLQKNMWISAMISGFVATGVHDLGVVLAFPSLLFLWSKRNIYPTTGLATRVISISIIGLSLLGYMIFLYFRFDNPIAFVMAQNYWDRKAVIPVLNIIVSLVLLFVKTYDWNFIVMCLVNGISSLVFCALGLMIVYDKKHNLLPLDMKVFFIVTLLLSIISGTGYGTQSYARLMCVIFPGFIMIARIAKNKRLLVGLMAVSLVIKFILLGMFSNGYWVT